MSGRDTDESERRGNVVWDFLQNAAMHMEYTYLSMHSEGCATLLDTGEARRPGSHGHLKGTSMKVISFIRVP